MYRSGYSYKDPRQARILAIRMKHDHFRYLLSQASVTPHSYQAGPLSAEAREKGVRVQWDPERDPKMKVLPYRSIQIGISGKLNKTWCEEWVESIEDVTEKAKELKQVVDEEPGVDIEELTRRGLVPIERPYEISDELRAVLEM